jgi:DNA (cytosine-5)-methyltransferase 1
MGLWQAGWAPVGIDNSATRLARYPFSHIQVDVTHPHFITHILPDILKITKPQLIIASPPCQGFSPTASMRQNRTARGGQNFKSEAHPPQNLVAFLRNILKQLEIPWIIENVPGAPLDPSCTIQLCGSTFGLRIRRHRLFESEDLILTPPKPACDHDWQDFHKPYVITQDSRQHGRRTGIISVFGTAAKGTELITKPNSSQTQTELARVAMGIDWMTARDLSQAIPPAYTRFLGKQALDQINIATTRPKKHKTKRHKV